MTIQSPLWAAAPVPCELLEDWAPVCSGCLWHLVKKPMSVPLVNSGVRPGLDCLPEGQLPPAPGPQVAGREFTHCHRRGLTCTRTSWTSALVGDPEAQRREGT